MSSSITLKSITLKSLLLCIAALGIYLIPGDSFAAEFCGDFSIEEQAVVAKTSGQRSCEALCDSLPYSACPVPRKVQIPIPDTNCDLATTCTYFSSSTQSSATDLGEECLCNWSKSCFGDIQYSVICYIHLQTYDGYDEPFGLAGLPGELTLGGEL